MANCSGVASKPVVLVAAEAMVGQGKAARASTPVDTCVALEVVTVAVAVVRSGSLFVDLFVSGAGW